MGSKSTSVESSQTAAEHPFDEIKKDLEAQRASLLSDAGLNLNAEQRGQAFPDLSDQASAEANQNFSLRLREREQKLLKKIDGALDRISNGTYGNCELCEEEIAIPRLKARPVTTFCIECKTKQEEEEKNRQ
ncbi:MAG: TraR/DksA family transcriptional regulator [Nitrospiria bacterium]